MKEVFRVDDEGNIRELLPEPQQTEGELVSWHERLEVWNKFRDSKPRDSADRLMRMMCEAQLVHDKATMVKLPSEGFVSNNWSVAGVNYRLFPGGVECEITYITEGGFDTIKEFVSAKKDEVESYDRHALASEAFSVAYQELLRLLREKP